MACANLEGGRLHVVCCTLSAARCLLHVVCCTLSAARCALHATPWHANMRAFGCRLLPCGGGVQGGVRGGVRGYPFSRPSVGVTWCAGSQSWSALSSSASAFPPRWPRPLQTGRTRRSAPPPRAQEHRAAHLAAGCRGGCSTEGAEAQPIIPSLERLGSEVSALSRRVDTADMDGQRCAGTGLPRAPMRATFSPYAMRRADGVGRLFRRRLRLIRLGAEIGRFEGIVHAGEERLGKASEFMHEARTVVTTTADALWPQPAAGSAPCVRACVRAGAHAQMAAHCCAAVRTV
jgi:hypothetical protein